MTEVLSLVETMVKSIVDDVNNVHIREETTEKGTLFEISVGREDVAKIIGKKGRVAMAMRVVAGAAGAKLGHKVLLNVMKEPI